MAKSQITFYATADDLGPVLASLEAESSLQYTLMELFETDKPQTYLSYVDIPNLGRSSHPVAAANLSYLLSHQGIKVRAREIPQKSGRVLFGIDQMLNEDTLVFRPAGRYGNDVILCGMVGTVSQSVISKSLYNQTKKQFRKYLKNDGNIFIGTEALYILKSGARLTIGASSPQEFDLKSESFNA